MITLVAYALCGTTYYWLDGRSDVYNIGWIAASVIWYVTISAAIIFVRNKTRLGYMIAGVLSWVTLAFWSFDNFYVVFDTSLIASEPNLSTTIRNFVGITIATIGVVSSHNLFHKVTDYQHKGKPI